MSSKELESAKNIAKAAGKAVLELYGKTVIEYKQDRSILTKADLKSERLIRGNLTKDFPNDLVLGEELGLSRGKNQEQASNRMWVVDPLDGTTNFAIRNPFFCVTISLVQDDEPILGTTYFPFQDELFWAEEGEGAFLNGKQIFVNEDLEPKTCVLTFCHGRDSKSIETVGKLFTHFKPINNKFRQIGAAALELAYVACGRTGTYFMPGVTPWDVSAGVVLVKEAHGRVTDLVGKEFTTQSTTLLASTQTLHPWAIAQVERALKKEK
ncbi:MAG: inositol monophosphatase family protein [Promethearchaeota archaeon]